MADYQIPEAPGIEQAYRAAHRALEGIALAGSYVPEAELPVSEVMSQFGALVRQAEAAAAAQLGPLVSWKAPHQNAEWGLLISGADLDGDDRVFGDIRLGRDAFEGPDGTWQDSACERAAVAYKRACGWDFTPDEAGIWLVMLAPVSSTGGETDEWSYRGYLAGFLIVYDRDNDGAYESVGHVWTAAAWRRHGIARRLLTEARSRFPLRSIERPYTDDGAALVQASAPDLS